MAGRLEGLKAIKAARDAKKAKEALQKQGWQPVTTGATPATALPTSPLTTAATAADPGLLSKAANLAYRKGFAERGPVGKVVVPALAGVYGLPLAAKAAMGTGGFALDVAKNLYGIGEETPAVAGYDPAAVLAATGATPMTDQQLADQAFEQYIQEAYGLAGPALEAMPKGGAGTAGAPAGANADIAAQTKAIQEATTAGGTEVSGLTPVSGTSARNLEAAAEQAKLQQQYLDFVKLQAAASGGKLGADWRKRYADQVQGEVARRRQQASEYRLQQALSQGDINRQIAAQRATQGITLPDPAVMQAKAEEYNNLDAQTKALYAINGITDVNSYVANYLKTIQPQG